MNKVRFLEATPNYYAPLAKWMIILCYERRGGGSIPSWGAKVYGELVESGLWRQS